MVVVSARSLTLLAALLAVTLLAAPAQAQPLPAAPAAVTIAGVDLHDGTIVRDGARFLLVGTMYGCGFQWGLASPWCGFGVSTSPNLAGPWTPPKRLFAPTDRSPYSNLTWQQLCGDTGAGCFNPRLVQRSGWGPDDGVWILWFNAPRDYSINRANAYYSMGCNTPLGPCGATAGKPYGSTTKPSLTSCTGNGDFSLVADNPRPPVMLCTKPDQTLSSERLSYWGATGDGSGGLSNLAGLTRVEGPGGYRDPRTGRWVMTFNDINCGYCAGSTTSYALADNPIGPYTAPVNVNTAWGATPQGRRSISGTSCGGQARTVTVLDSQPYQVIDLWLGTRNETGAGIHLEPLTYHGDAALGRPLQPFTPWTCT